MSHDGKIVTGYGAMAKSEKEARAIITQLHDRLGELDDQAAPMEAGRA
jgi:hypothetical protein